MLVNTSIIIYYYSIIYVMCQCWTEKDLSCLTGSELVYFLLHYSIYFVQSSRSTGSKSAPQYNTASTMPDSRYGVLGVKGLTFSFPNLLLLIVAKQLHFLFHMIRVFLQKVFFLSMLSAADIGWALRCPVWIKDFFLALQPPAHVDVKHTWLWTLTAVFQQLLIH